jgi:RND family efflux transporter MFP subunit
MVTRTRTATAVCLAAIVAGAGCGGKAEPTKPPAPEVSISQAVEEPVQESLEFTGRTVAIQTVEVRARVTGYITKVNFQDGAMVKQGDVLLEIDPREYDAAVLRAEGEVATLRSQLARAESEVARNQALRPSGAASARELEKAIAEKGSAEGELKAKLAQLELAKLDVEFSRVTAPISGRASKIEVSAGNLVVVGGSGGPLLTTIVSVDPIYVDFDADERSLLRLRKAAAAAGELVDPASLRNEKTPVHIGLADEEGFPYQGVLTFVDNRVDPSTGTIRVRAELANTNHVLTPGLFVRVRVPVSAPKPGLLVTDRAVGTDQDRKYLLVVNDKNVVEYRPVKLGPIQNGLRAVTEGVTAQDWIVVNGIQRARPGATVAPQKVSMRPGAAPAAAAPAAPSS